MVVAIGQAVLFGGSSPRLASTLTGPIVLTGCIVINFVIQGIVFSPYYYGLAAVATLVSAGIFGVVGGYLSGAVVAGVFMIAENFRRLPMLKMLGADRTAPSDREISIDDIE